MRNATERRGLAEDLRRAGYSVVAKDNCYDAAAYCRKVASLDALVIETELPDMWGLELARSASQYHPHIFVVCLCSAQPKQHVRHELLERGWQWTCTDASLHGAVVQKLQAAQLASD